ncbi:MAG: hypothetical protein HYW79_02160 [Parcubacteria group bacterium]|nr:hypothetical protein [Parcubacteria group bacterium]
MEKIRNKENKDREPDAVKLKELIENDPRTMSLTAGQMALREIEDGNMHSALARLRTELDKLYITNRELYDYILSFENLDRDT